MRIVKIAFIGLMFLAVFLAESSKNAPSLKTVVDDSLKDTKGTYGIYIKNLKTEEKYILNGDRVFEAGSLYKIWVMGEVFEKIKKGDLIEDEVLSQKIDVLNQKFEIAPEDAELTTGVISLTVKSALEQMITISHNYAALLLTEKIGVSNLKVFLEQNGFNKSSVGTPPKTTTTDMGLFFEKLYKGELTDQEASKKMIEILKKQKLNDGLPKNLPKEIQIAHKTGDIGWFKHDAGIVFAPNGDYIIVVMSESNSPSGAQERIANISKTVYDYFSP